MGKFEIAPHDRFFSTDILVILVTNMRYGHIIIVMIIITTMMVKIMMIIMIIMMMITRSSHWRNLPWRPGRVASLPLALYHPPVYRADADADHGNESD